ncbi:hypothetical protein JCM3766R1_004097 [Sporobolomyces carnicolor]
MARPIRASSSESTQTTMGARRRQPRRSVASQTPVQDQDPSDASSSSSDDDDNGTGQGERDEYRIQDEDEGGPDEEEDVGDERRGSSTNREGE